LGPLQHPSKSKLKLEDDKGKVLYLLEFSNSSQFEFYSDASSGTLVYRLPKPLQTTENSSTSATKSVPRYLASHVVARNFALWISVAISKSCYNLVSKTLASGTLFDLLIMLSSSDQLDKMGFEQSTDVVPPTRIILSMVWVLREILNNHVPVLSFVGEILNGIAFGKERLDSIVDLATAVISAAAPGAFMLSRRALNVMNSRLHPSALAKGPGACLVKLPVWVCTATSLQRCLLLPLFFAGRPIITMPNFGWAEIVLQNTIGRVSISCACVIGAMRTSDVFATVTQLSEETGLPRPAVLECLTLLLTQNACVCIVPEADTEEPLYRLLDASQWRVDGWVVLNHTSLQTSCSFFGRDYAAVCHWSEIVLSICVCT
jgi:hypothetical protein